MNSMIYQKLKCWYIERFNEWWFTGKIRKELAQPFKRHVLPKILESLKERQTLIIVGFEKSRQNNAFIPNNRKTFGERRTFQNFVLFF